MKFKDRRAAGRRLAAELKSYRGRKPVVCALPRGGVIVGAEVARALHAPLDLVIARKIGHPLDPEYAIGAVSEYGGLVCNPDETDLLETSWFESEAVRKKLEARSRRELYLHGRPPLSVTGIAAILVDDGIATGMTIFAAIQELKLRRPNRILAAIPVVSPEIAQRLRDEVDELVALEVPVHYLGAVSAYYRSFPQVSDGEVIEVLDDFARKGRAA